MTHAAATILRVRVPASLAAPAGRAALQRWLAEVVPQRYGFPAEAVIVVRRLQGSVAALAGRARHDPLAAVLRGALRPAREHFVGAGVTAVWFADEAELLACLARDALAGALQQHWWWPVVLPGAAPALPQVLRRWCSSARAVPQALQALAEHGDDAAWLDLLGAAGRAELLMALAQSYPVGVAAIGCVQACEQGDMASEVHGHAQLHNAAAARDAPPVATATRRLTSPAQILLRLAALLRTEPQRASDDQAAAWLHAPAIASLPEPSARVLAQSPSASAAAEPAAPQAGRLTAMRTMAEVLPAAHAGHGAPPLRVAVSAASVPQRAWAAQTAAGATSWPAPAGPASTVEPARPGHRGRQVDRPLPRPAVAPQGTIASDFGGLCFLLNVALAAGLYGDFAQPLHGGQPVSPWRFLHDAGRAFFGRRYRADPLAALLAARAGAQPWPAATALWQIDAACLHGFANDPRPWHAVRSPGRLRILHPAGFVVVQAAPDADARQALAGLALQPSALVWHRTAQCARAGDDLWGLLRPWLAQRLALSLGLPARRPALELVLAMPARIQARAERWDLHFSLAALPLAVRLAGLDRDPGWVPAAGSDIRFHFD